MGGSSKVCRDSSRRDNGVKQLSYRSCRPTVSIFSQIILVWNVQLDVMFSVLVAFFPIKSAVEKHYLIADE